MIEKSFGALWSNKRQWFVGNFALCAPCFQKASYVVTAFTLCETFPSLLIYQVIISTVADHPECWCCRLTATHTFCSIFRMATSPCASMSWENRGRFTTSLATQNSVRKCLILKTKWDWADELLHSIFGWLVRSLSSGVWSQICISIHHVRNTCTYIVHVAGAIITVFYEKPHPRVHYICNYIL